MDTPSPAPSLGSIDPQNPWDEDPWDEECAGMPALYAEEAQGGRKEEEEEGEDKENADAFVAPVQLLPLA
jgi:hypothetical protein